MCYHFVPFTLGTLALWYCLTPPGFSPTCESPDVAFNAKPSPESIFCVLERNLSDCYDLINAWLNIFDVVWTCDDEQWVFFQLEEENMTLLSR